MAHVIDTIIRNGRVIDPGNDIDCVQDVAIKDGAIFMVGKDLQVLAKAEFDATGYLVTPGLIDAHVHCYQYATPLGVNPDDTCLSRGVTTVVDAGSAGASTFMGLKKFIIEKSKTRVKALLHIASQGLAAAGCAGGAVGGESDTLAVLDTDACRRCIEEHRDDIVGVKVRLQSTVCCKGELEEEAYRRALLVSEQCRVPLMVHHIDSTVPTQKVEGSKYGCPADLRPGDIYTHTFHGYHVAILDPISRQIHHDVIDAKSRGVIFDVGHGYGSFNWTVAETAAKCSFFPDTLGSDLHDENLLGPVFDLVTVMSKFLHLGMPLYDIVRAVTSTPARVYGIYDVTGSLTNGKEADVTVLKIEDDHVMLDDGIGQMRNVQKILVPVAVWRAGDRCEIKPSHWSKISPSQPRTLPGWDRAVITDGTRPLLC